MLSIIVPVYNSSKYLNYCLNSIKNQTFSDFECILIDDGSTDESAKICKQFCKDDYRFRYFYKTNGGVAEARNYGVLYSKGDYLSFVDNDDILHPFMYEILMRNIFEYKTDVSACSYEKSKKDYNNIIKKLNTNIRDCKTYVLSNRNDIYNCITSGVLSGLIWNKVYKRKVIINNYFDTKIMLVDDADFTIRVFDNVKTVCYVNEKLYYWVQHGTNQTTSSSYISYYSATIAFVNMIKFCKQKGIEKKTIDSLYSNLSQWAVSTLDKYILTKQNNNNDKTYLLALLRESSANNLSIKKITKLKMLMMLKTWRLYKIFCKCFYKVKFLR